MDRFMMSEIEKQSIYEIFRACRLCGAGGGYKMPIIQNVIDLDGSDIDLRQKILECVRIEVNQSDKMPPLICELCVDKVNDFYEFLEMCRQTNKRTRLRLGLPPQTMPRGAPDAGDCILGVTEPIYINDDSNEPQSKNKSKTLKKPTIVKKEPEMKPKVESKLICAREIRALNITETRSSRGSRGQSPVRVTRMSKSAAETSPPNWSRIEEPPVLTLRSMKRSRDKEPSKPAVPAKKAKISQKYSPPSQKQSTKPTLSPKQTSKASPPPKLSPKPPAGHTCRICGQRLKTHQALYAHTKSSHIVTYTDNELACNACEEWFPSAEETSAHHKKHRVKNKPYHCRRCSTDFKLLHGYNEHFDKHRCVPWHEEPDVQCAECWKQFPTDYLRRQHKCGGINSRPGGTCDKCKKNYMTLKNLKKHEATCKAKEKETIVVDPEVRSQLKIAQVRITKCDPLLVRVKQEHYDVSNIAPTFGLDTNSVYPYISSVRSIRIKDEPRVDEFDGMVHIKEEFDFNEDYVHWDSNSGDSENEDTNMGFNPFTKHKKVESLSTLTLKTIFSLNFLGKVPKKRRKIKKESNTFDETLNMFDIEKDVNNIIDNLGKDDDDTNASRELTVNSVSKNINNDDSLDAFLQKNENKDGNANVTLDFDSLFKKNEEKTETEINESVNIDDDSNDKVQSNDRNADSNSVDSIVISISHIDAAIINGNSESINDNSNEDLSNNASKDHEESMDVDHNISQENETNDKLNNVNLEGSTQFTRIEENSVQKLLSENNDFHMNNENNDLNKQEGTETEFEEITRKDIIKYLNSEMESIEDNINADSKSEQEDTETEFEEMTRKDVRRDFNSEKKSIEGDIKADAKSENSDINTNSKENLIRNNYNVEIDKFNSESDEKSEFFDENDDSIITNNIQDENNYSLICKNLEITEHITEVKDDKNYSGENCDTNIGSFNEISAVKSINNIKKDNNSSEILQQTVESLIKDTNSSDVNNDNPGNSDVTNENSEIKQSEISSNNKYNMHDLEDISDTEMDDKKLMEAIDAQIGESHEHISVNNDSCDKDDNSDVRDSENSDLNNDFNATNHKNGENNINQPCDMENTDKITLEDLFPNKDSDLKSMDLDSISDDDFNFDA